MYKAFGQAYTEKSTMDYDNANRLKNKNVPPLEDKTAVAQNASDGTVIKFTDLDSILYGALGAYSYHLILAIIMAIYSIISLIFFESGGIVVGGIIFAVGVVLPIISNIVKYYNYKIYRFGDNIRIEHGAIQLYRTSFDIKRINAVRIRSPLFARIIGRCCIEAEVVGINASSEGNNDVSAPLLTLLIKINMVDSIMKEILPEFVCDVPTHKEPAKGLLAHLSRMTWNLALFVAIMAFPCMWTFDYAPATGFTGAMLFMTQYILTISTVTTVILAYIYAIADHRICEFGMGEDMIRVVTGPIDRSIVTVQYDRIQICDVSAGPMPRRFGMARGTMSILATTGNIGITTGFFMKDELEKISEITMERLSNGKYDYEKNYF